MILHHPTFVTCDILTLDITISPYTIIPLSLFYLFNSTCITTNKNTGVAPPPSIWWQRYITCSRMGFPIAVFTFLPNSSPYLNSTGAYTVHNNFEVYLRVPRFATLYSLIIRIKFTCTIHHGSDPLQTAPPPQCIQPPPPPPRIEHQNVKYMGHPYLWYPTGNPGEPDGKYNIMILTNMKTPDAVYCKNRLWYDVVCSWAAPNTDGGAQEGLCLVIRERLDGWDI